MPGITLLRTGCNKYTLITGNTNTAYSIVLSNINGKFSQTLNFIDNENQTIQLNTDGIYTLTSANGNLFFSTIIPYSSLTSVSVTYQQSSVYLAPAYTGYIITITLTNSAGNPVLVLNYTIQNTDTTVAVLTQNLINAINALSISGVTAYWSGTQMVIGYNLGFAINAVETVTMNTFSATLWSTCRLWECTYSLTTSVLCCKRHKCEEHVNEMRVERDELNRIMLLYTQFSMMNDDERWDYLPLSENTDILNDIFDKLNSITHRCGHCREELEKSHRPHRKDWLQYEIFSGSQAACAGNLLIQNVDTYTSIVYSDGSSVLALNFGMAQPTLNVVFPPYPANGQKFAINSAYAITVLTLTSSYNIQGYKAAGYFAGTPPLRWIFDSEQARWLIY
jgi:hypothetical protein